MSIDPNLGLSPAREGIRGAMGRLGFKLRGNLEQYLNALEYLKLARSEAQIVAGDSQFFTFAHRRFQEYFATCVVFSDLNRISPRQLLTDGRWRETAVVIFQTQPPEVFAPILAEARYLLDEIAGNISGLIDDPVGYVNPETTNKNLSVPKPFAWPDGLLPLLGLLQDGFISRIKELPDDIQMQAGRFLLTASSEGTLADQKWSLEVAGITPQPVLLWLLRHGFASESQWLKEVAYRQTARLSQIPDDIAADIRQALVILFARNRLNKEFFATHAHLSRLDQASRYINILRLLKWISPIDIILHIVVFCGVIGALMLARYELFVFISPLLFRSHLTMLLPLKPELLVLISPPLFLFMYHLILRKFFYYDVYPGYFLNLFFIRIIFSPLLLWSIFAISAANTGQFTHPFWWAFLLLFPVLYFIIKFRELIKYVIHKFKVIAFVTFLWLLIIVIMSWCIDNPDSVISKILFFSYSIIVVCFIPLTVIGNFISFISYIQDWIKWQKWLKIRPSSITAQELLNLITHYHHARFSKRLIIIIRERNSLLATEDSEQLLKELALALESSIISNKRQFKMQQRKWRKYLKNPFYAIKDISRRLNLVRKSSQTLTRERVNNYSGSEFFNTWLGKYTLKDKSRLVNLGSEFLDEIYILLEQIRARRQNSSVQND
ncbi:MULTISPECIES: hypothetical protein [Microcystis]|uniref:Genome sequencing data, contig C301 n=2 Tax=Microcystis aeruginosa (strain PCC 7806) TaxID=267872 RepID=A8YF11_MICA7|nr:MULTISPECIES: hypothetical protein [Microcystis]ARI81800.1 hypothetical protein BH695_2520 [Microcystis aeruginosa PCC 7806SL]ELS47452.1 hypothetical protein C789_2745 [Microcystis aeruginosa FACHB-905 = DIANCHI905]UGS11183.1 NTPase (NACHT family) [Microcystis aeruginosa FACHB-905 = DIANCHI905]WKX62329.1 NTPase (NACHT family) [Microcystis aeruginosa PCC 7806]CAO87076.1 unnamed protein product [Microcystis aeruginosa PCC 7806]